MRHYHENLTKEERQKLEDSIAYITIFIAQSDGVIESSEIEKAKKIAEIRTYSVPTELKEFYVNVGENFEEKLNQIMKNLPADIHDRFTFLNDELESYNEILDKTDHNFARALIKSWRSFATHVAKASGGFAGFLAISKEEANLIELPMIKDIID